MTALATGRPSIHSLLRIPYVLLILVSAGSVAGYVIGGYAGIGWLADWSPNAGTSAMSILLTVWLIDSVIQRSQERERQRMCRAAFGALRTPMVRHGFPCGWLQPLPASPANRTTVPPKAGERPAEGLVTSAQGRPLPGQLLAAIPPCDIPFPRKHFPSRVVAGPSCEAQTTPDAASSGPRRRTIAPSIASSEATNSRARAA